MKTVYLSGAISHTSYGECTGWRDDAEQALALWGIKALSPMRGKDFLRGVTQFTQDCAQYSDNPLSTPRGIMTRDRYDSLTCDVMLVNLLGATKVSIGTVMEIGWADSKRTPIVLVMEADGCNPHEHSMIHEAAGYRVDTLHKAVDIVRLLLGATNPLDDDRYVAKGPNLKVMGQRGAEIIPSHRRLSDREVADLVQLRLADIGENLNGAVS